VEHVAVGVLAGAGDGFLAGAGNARVAPDLELPATETITTLYLAISCDTTATRHSLIPFSHIQLRHTEFIYMSPE